METKERSTFVLNESREPGQRIRTLGVVNIDRSVFKKDKRERAQLKEAKLQCKIEAMKKVICR